MAGRSLRSSRAGFALTVWCAILSGCSGTKDATAGDGPSTGGTLRIVQQDWSGTSRTQPAPANSTHEAVSGAQIMLGSRNSPTVLRVDAVGGGEIAITVENVAPVNDSGGIDLNACGRQQFRLRAGGAARFATCSFDAGTSWTVTREP